MTTESTAVQPHTEKLHKLGASDAMVDFFSDYDSLQAAWDACTNVSLMLWLLGRTEKSKPYSEARKPLVRACLECARTEWEYMPQTGRACIELHERWCNGESIVPDQLRAAGDAAIIWAFTRPSGKVTDFCVTDTGVSRVAGASADDLAYWSFKSACHFFHPECADIVRRHFPTAPELP